VCFGEESFLFARLFKEKCEIKPPFFEGISHSWVRSGSRTPGNGLIKRISQISFSQRWMDKRIESSFWISDVGPVTADHWTPFLGARVGSENKVEYKSYLDSHLAFSNSMAAF